MGAFWVFVVAIGVLLIVFGVVLFLLRKTTIANVERAEEMFDADYGGKVGALLAPVFAVLIGAGLIVGAATRASVLLRIEEFLRRVATTPNGSAIGWLIVSISVCVALVGMVLVLSACNRIKELDETAIEGIKAGFRSGLGIISLIFSTLSLGVGIVMLSY